jgi:hypothetical protein
MALLSRLATPGPIQGVRDVVGDTFWLFKRIQSHEGGNGD